MDPDQQTFANMGAVFGDIWLGVILESCPILIGSFKASVVAQRVEHRRCRRRGFSPWVWKIPRGGNHNPLQYSCLGKSMNRGAWWVTVCKIAKSWTRLSAHSCDLRVLKRKKARQLISSFVLALTHFSGTVVEVGDLAENKTGYLLIFSFHHNMGNRP